MTDQEQQQLTAAGNEMSASFLAANKCSDATLAKLEAEPGKFTMLTGDRPTGRLHLGHYFGSIKERVAMQNRGVNTNIMQNGYNTANAITQAQFAQQQSAAALQAQLADCCCQNREAISGVNYNMATSTNAVTRAGTSMASPP